MKALLPGNYHVSIKYCLYPFTLRKEDYDFLSSLPPADRERAKKIHDLKGANAEFIDYGFSYEVCTEFSHQYEIILKPMLDKSREIATKIMNLRAEILDFYAFYEGEVHRKKH